MTAPHRRDLFPPTPRSGRGGRLAAGILVAILLGSLVSACGAPAAPGPAAANSPAPQELTLGAYTTPREAYGEVIPLFQAQWQAQTGQAITFRESYLGSGAQSRAIVEGFEADVAALSLEADIARLVDAGLITHDWHSLPYNGMVSTSIVVLGVRAGNPQGIQDWADLARPGLEVLTPNPKTSGGAMWNVLALYGAARRGFVAGVPAGDEAAATAYMEAVLGNVTVMDKGARESITTFEQGVGDVIITYENEVLVGRAAGQAYDYVIPRSTILIENPVALIDAYADAHQARAAAEAFVSFLFTAEAQTVFARHGLRSPHPEVAAATAASYPPVEDLFSIAEFGGWGEAAPAFFGEAGIYTQAIARVQAP